MEKKPPIGIAPKSFWEWHVKNERFKNLHAAIQRYLDVNLGISPEWVKEYNELTQYFKDYETKNS